MSTIQMLETEMMNNSSRFLEAKDTEIQDFFKIKHQMSERMYTNLLFTSWKRFKKNSTDFNGKNNTMYDN